MKKQASQKSLDLPPKSFIEEWCNLYGLEEATSHYLGQKGFNTGNDLLTLYVKDINQFTLDGAQLGMLRGAILQYRQLRDNTDKELIRRGVQLHSMSKVTKDYKRMWQKQTCKLAAMDNVVMAMLKPDEREKIRELRRRLHTKRNTHNDDGSSLYQRIMLQRQAGSIGDETDTSSLPDSIGSCRSLSLDSAGYQSPADDGIRAASMDGTPDPEQLEAEDEILNEVSKQNSSQDNAPTDDTITPEEDHPEVQLEHKLDEMLSDLDRLSQDALLITTDSPNLTAEESALETERALKRLEDELFTEEELALLAEAKRKEKKKKKKKKKKSTKKNKVEEEVSQVSQVT